MVKTGYHLAMSIRSDQKQNHKGLFIFPTSHGMWKFIYKLNNVSPKISVTFGGKAAGTSYQIRKICIISPIAPFAIRNLKLVNTCSFGVGVCVAAVWFGSHLNYKVDPKAISYVMMKRTMYIV